MSPVDSPHQQTSHSRTLSSTTIVHHHSWNMHHTVEVDGPSSSSQHLLSTASFHHSSSAAPVATIDPILLQMPVLILGRHQLDHHHTHHAPRTVAPATATATAPVPAKKVQSASHRQANTHRPPHPMYGAAAQFADSNNQGPTPHIAHANDPLMLGSGSADHRPRYLSEVDLLQHLARVDHQASTSESLIGNHHTSHLVHPGSQALTSGSLSVDHQSEYLTHTDLLQRPAPFSHNASTSRMPAIHHTSLAHSGTLQHPDSINHSTSTSGALVADVGPSNNSASAFRNSFADTSLQHLDRLNSRPPPLNLSAHQTRYLAHADLSRQLDQVSNNVFTSRVRSDRYQPDLLNNDSLQHPSHVEQQFSVSRTLLNENQAKVSAQNGILTSQSGYPLVHDQTESTDSEIDSAGGRTPAIAERASKKGKFPCPHEGCNRSFNWTSNLTAHVRRHNGEKPFKCEHTGCEARFPTKGNMQHHMCVHNKEQLVECPYDDCNVRFKNIRGRNAHLQLKHQETNPFRCDFPNCGKSFFEQTLFERHMRRHQKQTKNPYACSIEGCGKQLSSFDALKAHMLGHTEDGPYLCTHDQCERIYKRKCDLTRHLQMHKRQSESNAER